MKKSLSVVGAPAKAADEASKNNAEVININRADMGASSGGKDGLRKNLGLEPNSPPEPD
jgi:hypothetical protein